MHQRVLVAAAVQVRVEHPPFGNLGRDTEARVVIHPFGHIALPGDLDVRVGRIGVDDYTERIFYLLCAERQRIFAKEHPGERVIVCIGRF